MAKRNANIIESKDQNTANTTQNTRKREMRALPVAGSRSILENCEITPNATFTFCCGPTKAADGKRHNEISTREFSTKDFASFKRFKILYANMFYCAHAEKFEYDTEGSCHSSQSKLNSELFELALAATSKHAQASSCWQSSDCMHIAMSRTDKRIRQYCAVNIDNPNFYDFHCLRHVELHILDLFLLCCVIRIHFISFAS